LALVALAAPDLPELAADPLVRLLAGDEGDGVPAALPLEPAAAPVTLAAAEVVCRRFARALPGFENSSVDFVRQGFVWRDAALDRTADQVRVWLAARPLDIVLDRLRYPLGVVALAWTPTIVIERERS
jgi:hypothetical protein